MHALFSKIGQRIEKTPFKTLFVTVLVFAVMIFGATKVKMATGSETLVKTDNNAYLSNFSMEQEFGGDAIMILLEGERQDLLKIDTFEKMWKVEERLKYNDDIFAFVSPASLVHQITDKQGKEIKKQLSGMSDGLGEIGNRLMDIGSELAAKELPNPQETEKKQDELTGSMDLLTLVKGMGFKLQEGALMGKLTSLSEGLGQMGEKLNLISEGIGVFQEKAGMLMPYFPHNQQELDNILYEDGALREIFSDTIIDDQHVMVMVKLKGNLDDQSADSVIQDVSRAMEKEEFGVSYVISGKPVLDSSLRSEMKSNMLVMVASAVALMLIILTIVFKVRWRVLSLGIIFVSVLATLGLMGHLDVSMTMVSMAVFPILIGLGIDYSIQFQNRYEEEKSVKRTLTRIGKAVGLAVLATVLGFVSLFASPVPMIQDFGKMLTIGVIISFAGSIFLLMPILGARDAVTALKPEDGKKKINGKEASADRPVTALVNGIIKFAPFILILSIALAGLGINADKKVGVETDIETFMPQEMDALHDIHYIRDVVGSTNQMVLYLEDDHLLTESNVTWMRSIVEDARERFSGRIVDIKSIDSLAGNFADVKSLSFEDYLGILRGDLPESQRKLFLNDDMTKSVILMNVEHMASSDLRDFVRDMNGMLEDAPVKATITGKSVLDVEMVKGLTDGRMKMTMLGLGLVLLALLILYRDLGKAAIAVLPVVLIVGMSGGIMYLLGLKYTPITATLGALVLGMGTEMTIMLLERYLEERDFGKDKKQALFTTLKHIGKATLASGLTTVGGFSVLMASKFVILKDFGLMTVINISLAIIATFVILPAFIWVFDRLIVREEVRVKTKEIIPETNG